MSSMAGVSRSAPSVTTPWPPRAKWRVAKMSPMVAAWASPRASISLARCARALAWMRGDDYVSPDHIQQVAPEILRHRMLLTFEAEAEGITTDDFIQRLLELVAVP